MRVNLADHLGEGDAPGARHDAESLPDLAAVEDRIGRPARWRWVVGSGDRLDRGRGAAPGFRQFENRLGEAVPGDYAAAGEVIGAPGPVAGGQLLHDCG